MKYSINVTIPPVWVMFPAPVIALPIEIALVAWLALGERVRLLLSVSVLPVNAVPEFELVFVAMVMVPVVPA